MEDYQIVKTNKTTNKIRNILKIERGFENSV